MIWYHDDSEIFSILNVEENISFRVGSCQERCISVNTDGLVSGQAVLVEVEIDFVEPGPGVSVHIDVAPSGGLGGGLHHTDLLLAVYKQLVI